MITQGGSSVNVSRVDLLEKLKTNREIHKADYAEAVIGYRIKLLEDLKAATIVAEKCTDVDLLNLRVPFSYPTSYLTNYDEIIDMMEASVDEIINLDSSSFKSFYKNEWSWSRSFNSTTTLYKSFANNVQ
jgi:hypothetical protein